MLPMKRSSNGKKCFSYRGAKLWNSLQAQSKQATSLISFENTLKLNFFLFAFMIDFEHFVKQVLDFVNNVL